MSATGPPRTPAGRAPGHLAGPSRRRLGRDGEQLAAAHLLRLGWSILARNVRTRHGEIDLIALDSRCLVFVEVKTLRGSAVAHGCRARAPAPLEGLRPRQQARLRRLAAAWLAAPDVQRPRTDAVRFDAIGVVLDGRGRLLRLDHLQAAW